ncbi:hypothetical protein TKK_0014679 [Trichogramma kaykai]
MTKRRRIGYKFMDSGRNCYQNDDNDVQFVGEFKKVVVKAEPKPGEKRQANPASLRGEIFVRLKGKKYNTLLQFFFIHDRCKHDNGTNEHVDESTLLGVDKTTYFHSYICQCHKQLNCQLYYHLGR